MDPNHKLLEALRAMNGKRPDGAGPIIIMIDQVDKAERAPDAPVADAPSPDVRGVNVRFEVTVTCIEEGCWTEAEFAKTGKKDEDGTEQWGTVQVRKQRTRKTELTRLTSRTPIDQEALAELIAEAQNS